MNSGVVPPSFPLRSAFLALPLENQSKEHFQQLQSALEEYRDFLIFQNPETPHLTLQFWRELMEIEYRPLTEKAAEIAARSAPFILASTGVETFGKPGDEQVLYLALAFSPELATLKKLCPWPNIREFHPHVTLARIRHPQQFHVHRKKIFKRLEDAQFAIPVDRLRLYAQVEGRKQTVLEEYVFGGSMG